MAAGGPGDHWRTDLVNFGAEAFGEPVDSLIRDILRLGGHRLLDDDAPLGRRLWALWPTWAVGVDVPADLERDLRHTRDGLQREAAERGWEAPEPDDLFARLRRLESELTSRGREDVALRLADAVAAGATGTEVLMRLRSVLQSERTSGAALDPSLATQMEAVVEEVNTLLSA
ncbi:hypothetical protein ACFJGV_10700 [Cnuibacter sp. UC19_7]|uniref:hypothetical protein n=1 Tax=Cnuibacter sp. UC19_7 TaxID=3350166 RepID=UPI00366E7AD3